MCVDPLHCIGYFTNPHRTCASGIEGGNVSTMEVGYKLRDKSNSFISPSLSALATVLLSTWLRSSTSIQRSLSYWISSRRDIITSKGKVTPRPSLESMIVYLSLFLSERVNNSCLTETCGDTFFRWLFTLSTPRLQSLEPTVGLRWAAGADARTESESEFECKRNLICREYISSNELRCAPITPVDSGCVLTISRILGTLW